MKYPSTGIAHMLADIDQQFRLTAYATGIDRASGKVRAAMKKVPRDRFTPEPARAYADRPQPIGYGQTISQPFIVALMSELLDVDASDRILEIGTGSGYQGAIIAELGATLFSVEIVPQLAQRSAALLEEMDYHKVRVICGNGAGGYPDGAPYDKVIVTAAADQVPAPLWNQLRSGGLIVAPLGPLSGPQELCVLRKTGNDSIERTPVLAVNFVPFRQR